MQQERIRLLLVDGSKQHRISSISKGAANVFSRWPNFLASAFCLVFCLIAFVTVSLFIAFFLLNERFQEWEENFFSKTRRLENEFCKRATRQDSVLAARGALSMVNPNSVIPTSSENLFYLLIKPLTKSEACAVESVLRLCPDKRVYLIFLASASSERMNRAYEKLLKNKYLNLNEISANRLKYLKNSPFEGEWEDELLLLAAKVLTVWQFGGTALSPNLVMTNRKMLDGNTGYSCEVDREVLFCPEQCSPYVYQLIETSLKEMNKHNIERVIDMSIIDFCSSTHLEKIGCSGVHRINGANMCDCNSDHCWFIRLQEWKNSSNSWESEIGEFCPTIISKEVR